MKENRLLDIELVQEYENSLYKSVKWWEGKRLFFNIVLFVLISILLIVLKENTKRFGITYSIFWSLAYVIAANVFFSAGWGVNVIIEYYKLKFLYPIVNLKLPIFVLGLVFSLVLTVLLYTRTLILF